MDPVGAMLLGGAAWGGANSLLGVGASAADAALQYHYAKKMYQHRYRWAMDDMRKAGLNPVLAANGGNVSGMSSAPSTDFAGAVNSGVNSAMQTARSLSDMKAQQVTNARTEADTRSVQARFVEQSIRNNYLGRKEEALVKDAMARAANNTALATLNEARAKYADVYAENERNESWQRQHNMTTRDLANYEAINESIDRQRRRMDPATERKLAEELYRANILYKQMAPLWGGVNSAARVMAL